MEYGLDDSSVVHNRVSETGSRRDFQRFARGLETSRPVCTSCHSIFDTNDVWGSIYECLCCWNSKRDEIPEEKSRDILQSIYQEMESTTRMLMNSLTYLWRRSETYQTWHPWVSTWWKKKKNTTTLSVGQYKNPSSIIIIQQPKAKFTLKKIDIHIISWLFRYRIQTCVWEEPGSSGIAKEAEMEAQQEEDVRILVAVE